MTFFFASYAFYLFIYFNWRLITLQYCIDFAIHQHESATGTGWGTRVKIYFLIGRKLLYNVLVSAV